MLPRKFSATLFQYTGYTTIELGPHPACEHVEACSSICCTFVQKRLAMMMRIFRRCDIWLASSYFLGPPSTRASLLSRSPLSILVMANSSLLSIGLLFLVCVMFGCFNPFYDVFAALHHILRLHFLSCLQQICHSTTWSQQTS